MIIIIIFLNCCIVSLQRSDFMRSVCHQHDSNHNHLMIMMIMIMMIINILCIIIMIIFFITWHIVVVIMYCQWCGQQFQNTIENFIEDRKQQLQGFIQRIIKWKCKKLIEKHQRKIKPLSPLYWLLIFILLFHYDSLWLIRLILKDTNIQNQVKMMMTRILIGQDTMIAGRDHHHPGK